MTWQVWLPAHPTFKPRFPSSAWPQVSHSRVPDVLFLLSNLIVVQQLTEWMPLGKDPHWKDHWGFISSVYAPMLKTPLDAAMGVVLGSHCSLGPVESLGDWPSPPGWGCRSTCPLSGERSVLLHGSLLMVAAVQGTVSTSHTKQSELGVLLNSTERKKKKLSRHLITAFTYSIITSNKHNKIKATKITIEHNFIDSCAQILKWLQIQYHQGFSEVFYLSTDWLPTLHLMENNVSSFPYLKFKQQNFKQQNKDIVGKCMSFSFWC